MSARCIFAKTRKRTREIHMYSTWPTFVNAHNVLVTSVRS